MPVDDIYRVSITATGQGSIYQNTFALSSKLTGDPSTTDFATFVADFTALWKPLQSPQTTYTEWSATQLWGPNMTIVANKCVREGGREYSSTMTGVGEASIGDALPPQNAMVVTWLTGISGKRRRGRTYGFGMVEFNQADGVWISNALNAMTTRLTTFNNIYKDDTGTSPNFTAGVWSERVASGCVPATPPARGHVQVDTPHPELAFTPLTSYVLRPTVFSQRRRTRGVGR